MNDEYINIQFLFPNVDKVQCLSIDWPLISKYMQVLKTVKNMKCHAAKPVEREIFITIYPRINLITDSNNFSMGLSA